MDAELLYGIAAEQICIWTGVDLTTARRWKRSGRIPEPARRLLALMISGDLGVLSGCWRGWSLLRDVLTGPDGITAAPAEVLALPFIRAQVGAYQARIRFSPQADWVDRKYVEPGQNDRPMLKSSSG